MENISDNQKRFSKQLKIFQLTKNRMWVTKKWTIVEELSLDNTSFGKSDS